MSVALLLVELVRDVLLDMVFWLFILVGNLLSLFKFDMRLLVAQILLKVEMSVTVFIVVRFAMVAVGWLLVSELVERSQPLIVVVAEMIDLVIVLLLVDGQVIVLHLVAIVMLIDLLWLPKARALWLENVVCWPLRLINDVAWPAWSIHEVHRPLRC